MRQISSKLTFYYKRIFPIIWFGLLVVFLVMAVLGITSTNNSFPAMPLIVPIVMAVVGYTFMKKLVFDLVDEVFDDGNALVVRNGGKEDRIALSNIVNVSYSPYVNPPGSRCRCGGRASLESASAFARRRGLSRSRRARSSTI